MELHVEPDFVKWYLENFEYLPIKFINLQMSETIDAFESFFENNSGRYIFNYTSDKFLRLTIFEIYHKNKDLYKLYFSKNFRQVIDMVNFIDELYLEADKIYTKLEIAEFVFGLAYNYLKETELKYDFFESQHNYRKKLKKEQLAYLKWYTYKGDKIVNTFLRDVNKLDIDKTYQHLIENLNDFLELPEDIDIEDKKDLTLETIEEIISVINKTILKAPKNKTPFVVYQYSRRQVGDNNNNTWENSGFYSTTLLSTYGINISSVYNNYKSHIIIPENTPCLILNEISVFPGEREILFSSKNCFKVLKPYTEYFLEPSKPYYKRLMVYDHKGACN